MGNLFFDEKPKKPERRTKRWPFLVGDVVKINDNNIYFFTQWAREPGLKFKIVSKDNYHYIIQRVDGGGGMTQFSPAEYLTMVHKGTKG